MSTEGKKTALIILDMAKGYGWQPGCYGYEIVPAIRRLKDAAHAAGIPVLHVHSMRRPTDERPSEMMIGTENLDVIPELLPIDQDIMVYKRWQSGFSHNDLDYTLRRMGIEQLILVGASTENCVLWTAADAWQIGYKVIVPPETTSVSREAHTPGVRDAALNIIEYVLKGDVSSLDDAIARYLPATAAA